MRIAISSPDFTLQGSVWDATAGTASTSLFTIKNDVIAATSSLFTIQNTQGTALLTLSQTGNASITSDLTVGKRLFLGSKTKGVGSETYLFVDDALGSTSSYIATNADGWQTASTFDYAERYESSEVLAPGDLVTTDPSRMNRVKRARSASEPILGIVSTQPAFVTGGSLKGSYPIALAGRVPTRVSTAKGAIKIGDALMASNVPGVAVKAVAAGNIVGIALEAYDNPIDGLVSVFVKPGYSAGAITSGGSITSSHASTSKSGETLQEGFATILAGSTDVKVSFPTILAYPIVYATPNDSVGGSWWISNRSDTGFSVVMSKTQTHDVEFAWMAKPAQAGMQRFLSDSTSYAIDPMTAKAFGPKRTDILSPVIASSTAASSSSTPDLPASKAGERRPTLTFVPIPVSASSTVVSSSTLSTTTSSSTAPTTIPIPVSVSTTALTLSPKPPSSTSSTTATSSTVP